MVNQHNGLALTFGHRQKKPQRAEDVETHSATFIRRTA